MKWHFKKEIKLYVERNEVQVGFRISDTAVFKSAFTIAEFEYIINNWRTGVEGYRTEMAGRIFWGYRDCGPRPDCEPMEFVAISIKGYEFRISVDGMEDAERQFQAQTA